ncbi:MAG: RNA polymerase sigma-70 factor [Flavobacteriales bacterium CG03_land_8_20_14_0_80_35_15]|nr:RNA polymerase sigma-70 factor [Zetaproteobacteria bacterium]NDK17481.1 RNA polymerase sigma-70 factor [Flavobacteriales bacterium]OIO09327.1 MAG: RNA polymerase sigma-70 factor [Flavobacteriaceae bacterium CG1_02_35_72]PIV16091.1 MAG: RNA polymerase sigma-70 factor [Flavobacteriales bacterium CG03_land_8_20_14_0_80_35_15]PIX07713.1 MAG: RNA polymerase sigma-70 factor [Flavobacteriales bacterium CG_4_8_14_3_um_filter_35_10]PJA06955.1 MAG: RNA polymerase sigma-70 factor [Flavobacteriales bac
MIKKFSNNELLIKFLKKGNEKAYTYLVDKYYHHLCVYANSLIRDKYQAEDIVQNVLLNIWKKREELKEDFNIKYYLLIAVRNEFIDQYRKKQSRVALEKEYYDALDLVIESKDYDKMQILLKNVNNEIKKLPPKCEEIFLMSKQENLTNIEIAEYLNISIKTVEGQITKAFRILRNKLDIKIETILFLSFWIK